MTYQHCDQKSVYLKGVMSLQSECNRAKEYVLELIPRVLISPFSEEHMPECNNRAYDKEKPNCDKHGADDVSLRQGTRRES